MTKLEEKYPELSKALGKQDTNYVKNFIENNSKEIIGDALYWCAHGGRLEDLKFFVAQGVDVDTQDEDGNSALHGASRENQISIMKWLIEDQHANIHIRDEDGSIPLHWASLKGNVAAIELLITHGSVVNAQDRWKRTPLHEASEKGHVAAIELLITHGSDVNATDEKKQTPLHKASEEGHVAAMELLITHGSDVNAQINGNRHLCIKQVKRTCGCHGATHHSWIRC